MKTFTEAMSERRLADPHKMSRKFRPRPKFTAAVPDIVNVLRKAVELPGAVNRTTDPDCDYPEFSFSSQLLTDWYVSEFCRCNGLKEPTL